MGLFSNLYNVHTLLGSIRAGLLKIGEMWSGKKMANSLETHHILPVTILTISTLISQLGIIIGGYMGRWCMGRWCSGILSGLLRRRSGVRFPDPPTLVKCAKGICLCNPLRSTQPNDRENVIEG